MLLFVKRRTFGHVWIDTISIDKTSSAELSEAINSMWKWYRDAEICYVDMEDVVSDVWDLGGEEIKKSRWFTRGWTLQELIAPREMVFLSSHWVTIGNKEDLLDLLRSITHIDEDVLRSGMLAQRALFSGCLGRLTDKQLALRTWPIVSSGFSTSICHSCMARARKPSSDYRKR